MGFRFRKSFGAGPFRVNLSKSGIGYSVGGKGFRFTKKAGGGTRTTASIPGTGISYVKDSKKKSKKNTQNHSHKAYDNDEVERAGYPDVTIGVYIILAIVRLLLIAFMGWAFCGIFPEVRCVWIAMSILLTIPIPAFQNCISDTFHLNALVKLILGVGFFLFGGLMHNNLIHALVLIAVAVVCTLVFKHRQSVEEVIEPIQEPAYGTQNCQLEEPEMPSLTEQTSVTQVCTQPEPKQETDTTPYTNPKNPRKEQFEAELQSIPRVEVTLSDPVQRHLLKDIPDYTFSNITRVTRLDSIFPLVFLDVETTGLYPSKHEIIEVSAIKFDTGMVPVSCFTTFCKPRNPIPPEITDINHITNEMVADAPAFNEIAPALTEFIKGCNVAGHNLDFDLRFIFAHGAELPEGKRFYDTLDLAQLTIQKSEIDNYKLQTLCFWYGIWPSKAHSSLCDCYATSKVFIELVKDKTSRDLEEIPEVVSK